MTEPQNGYKNCDIEILRPRTRNLISSLLNPLKIIRSEKGYPRDWQGLEELCGIPAEITPSLHSQLDPTGKILRLWSENCKKEATIANLINYLEELDRYDIVDDVLPLIQEDVKYHREHPPNSVSVPEELLSYNDQLALTQDDVKRLNKGLPPQIYDAFVLFHNDDINFATELVDTMEKEYNMKFCVTERDLVIGHLENAAVIKLISQRCKRLIAIISRAFLDSNSKTYFYDVAQSIGIEHRHRRVIPCIYKDCGVLPPEINCCFKLDFRRRQQFCDPWKKLYYSLIADVDSSLKNGNSMLDALEEAPKSKIQLVEPVSRLIQNNSQSNEALKPALHKETNDSHRNIEHVKFSSSMSNLPQIEVPEDNMVPSTSAGNLGECTEKDSKKSISLYKRIILKFPKYKVKAEAPTETESERKIHLNENEMSEDTKKKPKKKKDKEKKRFTLPKLKIALVS